MMYRAMIAQRTMIRGTEGQIADQTDHCLHQGPTRWRMEQLDYDLYTIIQSYGILCHFRFTMTRGQVTQGAYRWLGYLLAIAGVDDCTNEGIDTTEVAHRDLKKIRILIFIECNNMIMERPILIFTHFVTLIVASQIG